MEAIERIALYNTLFYVSMGIAVLGLVLSVFFFIYFDIPAVRAMMTGKAKKETIRRMEEQNAKTGKLRSPISGTMDKTGKTGKTARTQPQKEPAIHQPAAPVAASAPVVEDTRPETSVLHMATPETSVLQADAPETMVLGHQPIEEEECGKTAILHPVQNDFRFLVTEATLVVHTDEVI